jgi:hypothetical protein
MATLSESQAFLDQFDKCLPLCERGDAVTVVNALHSLNEITKAGLPQALELDPASGRDFVSSFLLELELALELYISPSKKLGTIDGGLPKLYSYNDDELSALADVPSRATKAKVLKFLEALGVAPSTKFQTRSVKDAVSEFLAAQVKPATKQAPMKERDNRSISWADLCSSSGSECGSVESDDDLPPLEVDEGDEDEPVITQKSACEIEAEREACDGFFGAESDCETSIEEDEEEDVEYDSDEESVASGIFLWAAPVKHSDFHFDDNCSPRTAAHNKAISDARRSRALYPFFKTVMCKNHPNCKYGDKCNFAHGEAELRKLDETILDAVARSKSPDSETSSQTASDRRTEDSSTGGTSNFKTRMCKNYEKNGFCKFGDRCNFAHGRDEIQQQRRRDQNKGGRTSPCGSQDSGSLSTKRVTTCARVR